MINYYIMKKFETLNNETSIKQIQYIKYDELVKKHDYVVQQHNNLIDKYNEIKKRNDEIENKFKILKLLIN